MKQAASYSMRTCPMTCPIWVHAIVHCNVMIELNVWIVVMIAAEKV